MPAKASRYTLGSKEVLIDLEVPSGAYCQVRRPGPLSLMQAGLFDNIDVLGSLIQTDHIDRVNGKPGAALDKSQMEQIQELIRDKAKIAKAQELIDAVICHVVVQPEISPNPPEGEERDKNKTYVDSVDFNDKVFIFQFVVGGSADLASFRQEFGAVVGSVADLQAVRSDSQ